MSQIMGKNWGKSLSVDFSLIVFTHADGALGGASSREAKGMMESGKRNADLEEWDAKIRKLTEEFEESDTELEECDTENGELTEEIDNLTAELEERDRKISKLAAELGECDKKIKERDRKITKLAAEVRRLTALLGDRDSRLRKLTAELTKCDATIRIFTVELGEQHTKIGELTADVRDCNRKIRRLRELLEERDSEIRKQDAVIRKLTEELEERKEEAGDGAAEEPEESDLERDELTEELGERDKKIEEITEELAERGARIDELTAELGERDAKIEKRDRKIDELTAELEEYKAKTRKCMEEHRKEEEKMANVTLDPETAHPRLVLSKDLKSVRWEYVLRESPDSPERFDADPCVLGCEAFTSGRHCWVVDLTEGQYCAIGVTKESLRRKGPIGFNPEEGIWAVQQWGFQNRALTSPPTLLNLPRVPKKIRVSLDYEWGEVAFYDVENKIPIFTFPPASFAGERIRPWFWVELGSISLVR
ncbi:tripartite motif-containing protein 10-like isoform X11 [Chroicocephalus ridibundus]|uniref:tripartite motif-containing protein 10-like isoform X11 n=1 Tax=Chroicocephalus ridibundus TaxID=1192867 RepID=UPI002FDDB577